MPPLRLAHRVVVLRLRKPTAIFSISRRRAEAPTTFPTTLRTALPLFLHEISVVHTSYVFQWSTAQRCRCATVCSRNGSLASSSPLIVISNEIVPSAGRISSTGIDGPISLRSRIIFSYWPWLVHRSQALLFASFSNWLVVIDVHSIWTEVPPFLRF